MRSIRPSYSVHRTGLLTISVMNVLLALTSIGLEVFVLATNPLFPAAENTRIQGIWCGVFYLSAGFAGLLILSKTTKFTLIFALIATLLSIIFATVSTVLTAIDGCLAPTCDDEGQAIGVSFIACNFFVMMASLAEMFIVSIGLCRKVQPSSVSLIANLTAPSIQKLSAERTYE